MKKIIIVGANSFIGKSFENWLSASPDQYKVDTIGTNNGEWKEFSFSEYDALFHVAGIAHVSADPKLEDLYYKINRDLAIEVATKAKNEGVKQFIFMSSIIIYGKDGNIGAKNVITNDTPFAPIDFYGKSKLEADLGIQKLKGELFSPVIIRTPVVYGPGCKGNFPKLVNFAKKTLIFPDIVSERSMIYIDNLCEFIKMTIDQMQTGVFYPQNQDYVSTTGIVKETAKRLNRRIVYTKLFNGLLVLLSKRIDFINKVFGNKVYDQSLSSPFVYNVVSYEESIKRSL